MCDTGIYLGHHAVFNIFASTIRTVIFSVTQNRKILVISKYTTPAPRRIKSSQKINDLLIMCLGVEVAFPNTCTSQVRLIRRDPLKPLP